LSQTEKTKQQELIEKLFNDLLVQVNGVRKSAYHLNYAGNKVLKANTELSTLDPRNGYNLEELQAIKRLMDLCRQIELDLAKYEEYFIESQKVNT
jgi:hypothetical protein